MTNPNLIATSIVDKNGKPTTVHKRAVSTKASSTLAAAKPKASPAASHIDRLSDEAGSMEFRLKQELSLKARRLSNKKIGEMLDQLHPDTLRTLENIVDEWDGGDFIVSQSMEWAAKGGKIAPLNNLALFYDKTLGKDYQRRMFHAYIGGLDAHTMDGEPTRDFTQRTEAEQRSMRALLEVTLNLPSKHVHTSDINHELWTYLPSTPLVELIIERPEDADRITKIITERPDAKFHSPEEIEALRDMLDQNITSSLTNGIL
jgi:hypothetical protein